MIFGDRNRCGPAAPRRLPLLAVVLVTFGIASVSSARAQVLMYGNANLFGFGYPAGQDPTAGAQLVGLTHGRTTGASAKFPHTYPFFPMTDDFPGTHQMFHGSVVTECLDGYCTYGKKGPMKFQLDYSSLLPTGKIVQTLTLGIAADDMNAFNPFVVRINGHYVPNLERAFDRQRDGGPKEHFLSFGVHPEFLKPDGILRLTIDEGGNGGDGWAVDFLTIGVTTN